MSGYFVPGWDPEYAKAAADQMEEQGGYCTADYGDDSPLPPAMSLSRLIRWHFDQGPVGSCFSNNTAQAFQISTASDNADGLGDWDEAQLSRAMIWHGGRKLDGLLGSRSDGGSITNAMKSLMDGCCRESSWAYKPNHAWLEREPDENAVAEARLNRVTGIAAVEIGDAWKRSIKNGDPVAIGIWWPFGWDTNIGRDGRATGIGSGTFGHALAVTGWIDDWGGKAWWQIENSHGAIYNPIPRDVAERIPGYASYSEQHPSQVFDFWVSDDMLRTVIGYGNSEAVVAAGVNGFRTKPMPWDTVL